MSDNPIQVNRAPVLALWATVVAERLGHSPDTALTLGRCVTSSSARIARIKARSIGITDEAMEAEERSAQATALASKGEMVRLLGKDIPVVTTEDRKLWACVNGKPMAASGARAYIARAFGDRVGEVRAEMEALAASFPSEELNRIGFRLYESFRPDVPRGAEGWGAKGVLHLDRIRVAAGIRRT